MVSPSHGATVIATGKRFDPSIGPRWSIQNGKVKRFRELYRYGKGRQTYAEAGTTA